jgi:membrane protein
MKKLLMYIISVIMLISTAILIIFIDKQHYDEAWKQLGKTSSSCNVYIKDSQIDTYEGYNILTELADRYQANIYRSDNENINGNDVSVKSVYITYNDNVYNKIALESGHIPDNNELISGNVLKTGNFDDDSEIIKSGELYSFLDKQKLKVQSLQSLLQKSNNICGTYTVNFQDRNTSADFINELASKLGKTQDEITRQTVFYQKTTPFIFYILIIIVLTSLALFFLLAAYYIVKQFKEIGICKMLGYDNISVWSKYFMPFLLVEAFASTFIILTSRIITNIPRETLFHILFALLVIIILTALICLIFYGLLKKYTISSLIKKRSPASTVVKLNFLVRTILLTIVCSITLSAVYGFTAVKDEYKIYEKWDEYGKKYAVFNLSFSGEDHSDMMNNTHLREQKQAELYNIMDKNGAAYAKLSEFYPCKSFASLNNFDHSLVDENYKIFIMTVNTNYLKTLNLKDIDGNPIEPDNSDDRGIILIPESRAEDETLRTICETYRYYTIDSSKRYVGEKIAEKKNAETQILYYKDNMDFFTFSTTIKTNDDYTVKSPVFSIMTEENATFLQKSGIVGGNETSPLKIDISDTSADEAYEKFLPYIRECGLEENITELTSISSIFEDKISDIKTSMKIYFAVSLGMFLLSCWISCQTVKMMIDLNRKKLGIKKLLGFTFFDNYKYIILTFVAVWPVIMLAAGNIYLSMDNTFKYSVTQFIVSAAIGILDISLIILQIKHLEKKNLSILLKEG